MRNTVSLARSLAFLEWYSTVAFYGCGNDAKIIPLTPVMCPNKSGQNLMELRKFTSSYVPCGLKDLGNFTGCGPMPIVPALGRWGQKAQKILTA